MEYITVETTKDRYVPVPSYLVRPIEQVERTPTMDTVALGAALKQCRVRVQQANGQLAEIASIEPGDPHGQ